MGQEKLEVVFSVPEDLENGPRNGPVRKMVRRM